MNLSVLASTSNRTVDPKVVAMDSVEIPSAAGGVNNELMSQIDTLISSKFASLEDRMTSAQKNIADSQLSKIKEDILSNDSYVFKRKSCEDQFKFNVKVSSKLRDADVSVKNGDAGAACSSISEGLDLISNRPKLIRLADSSELGWSVVKSILLILWRQIQKMRNVLCEPKPGPQES